VTRMRLKIHLALDTHLANYTVSFNYVRREYCGIKTNVGAWCWLSPIQMKSAGVSTAENAFRYKNMGVLNDRPPSGIR
jgi:hypothetical protein